MTGLVEVDKLVRTRAIRDLVLVVIGLAVIVSWSGNRAKLLAGLAIWTALWAAVVWWRGRPVNYVVHSRMRMQLPPPTTPVRALAVESAVVLAAWILAIGISLIGPFPSAADYVPGFLVGCAAGSAMGWRAWRRLVHLRGQQIWIPAQPLRALKSWNRLHADGVFLLLDEPSRAVSLPPTGGAPG